MDHISAPTLHFMNYNHTDSRITMSKQNTDKRISFDRLDMGCRKDTFDALVGTKRLVTKEGLPIQSMTYSQLVGGFVGSKSQLGTSSRMSCQVWDIVFSKLMPFLDSHNITPDSPLKSSEYSCLFVQELATDMFDSMYRDISEPGKFAPSFCMPAHTEKYNMLGKTSEHQLLENSKQSYADVAKTAKHTEAVKFDMKTQNISCSKNDIDKHEMVPAWEILSSSKKKKRGCRRRKDKSNCNIDKKQNSYKEGTQLLKNEKRRKSKMTDMKREKNVTSDGKNSATTNTTCNVKDTIIDCSKKKHFMDNMSLRSIKQQQFSTSQLSKCIETEAEFLIPVEKHCFHPQIKIIPNDIMQQCDEEEVQRNQTELGDTILFRDPFSSDGICRTYSESSGSDDFVIFKIVESDESIDNGSDDEKYSEIFNTHEDDSQLPEDLKTVNERWQKMYPCIQGKATEPVKVHFAPDEKLKTVHSIIAWDFAYRAARIGPWEQIARDQERFKFRILKLEKIISPVLTKEHRLCVYHRTIKSSSADDENNQCCD